jgi:hypothetical protein
MLVMHRTCCAIDLLSHALFLMVICILHVVNSAAISVYTDEPTTAIMQLQLHPQFYICWHCSIFVSFRTEIGCPCKYS